LKVIRLDGTRININFVPFFYLSNQTVLKKYLKALHYTYCLKQILLYKM